MVTNFLLLIAVLGFELASCTAFYFSGPVTVQALIFSMTHGIASILLSLLLLRFLPERYRQLRKSGFLFLFLVAFFIPLLGGIGLASAVLSSLYWPKKTRRTQRQVIDIPELSDSYLHINPQSAYGSGGLLGVLRNVQSTEARIRAVVATRQMRRKEAIPILQTALRDPEDDVRLLAYSMLDQKERIIFNKIKEQMLQLKQVKAAMQGPLYSRIAHNYWELVYLGLGNGELLSHVLNSAGKNCESALELMPQVPALHFLQGRILLRKQMLEAASSAFIKAQNLGHPRSEVLPYLAEVAFIQRRFHDVRNCLRAIDPATYRNSPLASVVAYWL